MAKRITKRDSQITQENELYVTASKISDYLFLQRTKPTWDERYRCWSVSDDFFVLSNRKIQQLLGVSIDWEVKKCYKIKVDVIASCSDKDGNLVKIM